MTAAFEHDIPPSLIVNLDQTLLNYVFPERYTPSFRGAKNVLIKGLDNNNQITRTFAVIIIIIIIIIIINLLFC